jgi:hypothetical protein
MGQGRTRIFRAARWLAILGVLANVCVLALHTASQASASLGGSDVICAAHMAGPVGHDSHKPQPAKPIPCPICSGLATLHLALLIPEIDLIPPRPAVLEAIDGFEPVVGFSRMIGVGNRGPPALL